MEERFYHLSILCLQELSEEEISAAKQMTETKIGELEGILKESTKPMHTTLAYPVKNNGSAWVFHMIVQGNSSLADAMNSFLKGDSRILRFSLTTMKPAEVEEILHPKKRATLEPSRHAPMRAPAAATPLSDEAASQQEEKPKPKVELEEIEKKLAELLQ